MTFVTLTMLACYAGAVACSFKFNRTMHFADVQKEEAEHVLDYANTLAAPLGRMRAMYHEIANTAEHRAYFQLAGAVLLVLAGTILMLIAFTPQ